MELSIAKYAHLKINVSQKFHAITKGNSSTWQGRKVSIINTYITGISSYFISKFSCNVLSFECHYGQQEIT